MSIKAVDGTRLFVVYCWDGYDSDVDIICICATEKQAKAEARRRNLEYIEEDILTEEGDIIWEKTNSDSQYYTYTQAPLII